MGNSNGQKALDKKKGSTQNFVATLYQHLLKNSYLRYAKFGSPSFVGTSTLPWIKGLAYAMNASLTSEPSFVIHSVGTPFSLLQMMLTSAVEK